MGNWAINFLSQMYLCNQCTTQNLSSWSGQRRSQLRDHRTDWVQSSGEAGAKIHSSRVGKSTFVTKAEAQIKKATVFYSKVKRYTQIQM